MRLLKMKVLFCVTHSCYLTRQSHFSLPPLLPLRCRFVYGSVIQSKSMRSQHNCNLSLVLTPQGTMKFQEKRCTQDYLLHALSLPASGQDQCVLKDHSHGPSIKFPPSVCLEQQETSPDIAAPSFMLGHSHYYRSLPLQARE